METQTRKTRFPTDEFLERIPRLLPTSFRQNPDNPQHSTNCNRG